MESDKDFVVPMKYYNRAEVCELVGSYILNLLIYLNPSIQFHIESFYPSITRGLMNKAIGFAKTIVDIPDEDLLIIMQSRKTLFSEKVP